MLTMSQQHLPATIGVDKIAQRIDDLAEIGCAFQATLVRRRHQGRGFVLPFFIGQAKQLTLRTSDDVGHPVSLLSRSHSGLESSRRAYGNPLIRISKNSFYTI